MTEVIFLGSNRYGDRVYKWLVEHDDTDVLCMITDESQYDVVRQLEPDILVSAGFKFIVPSDIIDIPERGAVNLHPSYLPYNRGYNPSVWSIIKDEPAGVSIHYMMPDLDSGPIIARSKVSVRPDDDGKSIYNRLEDELVDLFKNNWDAIRHGTVDTTPQTDKEATYHYKEEFLELCEIDPDESIKAADFIDRLRALTFDPYNNAFIERGGEKYYLKLEIIPESETEPGQIHWNLSEYSTEDN